MTADPRVRRQIDSPEASPLERLRGGWNRYWYEAVPPRRLAILSFFVYGVVLLTLATEPWMRNHACAPESFYQPVWIARVLQVPPPTTLTSWLVVGVIVSGCLLGFTRRAPRTAGLMVFVGYGLWILWAFSWAKVDHDRLTIIVALFVLAVTPATGRAAAALTGWGVRLIQVVFLLAYPLSALAKIRFNDWTLEWLNSAVFTRAIVRRGTWFADLALEAPMLLRIGQWALFLFEIAAIVLLLPRGKLRYIALGGVLFLHAITYSTITIHFLPHTVCVLAFFPLERVIDTIRDRLSARRLRDTSAAGSGTDADVDVRI